MKNSVRKLRSWKRTKKKFLKLKEQSNQTNQIKSRKYPQTRWIRKAISGMEDKVKTVTHTDRYKENKISKKQI